LRSDRGFRITGHWRRHGRSALLTRAGCLRNAECIWRSPAGFCHRCKGWRGVDRQRPHGRALLRGNGRPGGNGRKIGFDHASLRASGLCCLGQRLPNFAGGGRPRRNHSIDCNEQQYDGHSCRSRQERMQACLNTQSRSKSQNYEALSHQKKAASGNTWRWCGCSRGRRWGSNF